MLSEFHSPNAELGSLVVSVYLLGFAAGPLLIAPLSELYGRMPLYHICNLLFAALTVGCALAPSLSSEIGLRFLQGCAGSAPLAIGGERSRISYRRSEEGSIWGYMLWVLRWDPFLGLLRGVFDGGEGVEMAYVVAFDDCEHTVPFHNNVHGFFDLSKHS